MEEKSTEEGTGILDPSTKKNKMYPIQAAGEGKTPWISLLKPRKNGAVEKKGYTPGDEEHIIAKEVSDARIAKEQQYR